MPKFAADAVGPAKRKTGSGKERTPSTPGPKPFVFVIDEHYDRDDYDKLRRCAEMHCTKEETAAFFSVTVKTFRKALKADERAKFIWDTGLARGRASLRRMQWESAEKGSVPMQIWLGKQLLGQTDSPPEIIATAEEIGKAFAKSIENADRVTGDPMSNA